MIQTRFPVDPLALGFLLVPFLSAREARGLLVFIPMKFAGICWCLKFGILTHTLEGTRRYTSLDEMLWFGFSG